MSETRREVLTKLLMGPLATLGVQNASRYQPTPKS